MHAVRLPTVGASIASHQGIPVQREEWAETVPGSLHRAGPGVGGGVLYGPMVQGIMSNGHMGPPTNRQTFKHDWKHYLPATSFTGGKNYEFDISLPTLPTRSSFLPGYIVSKSSEQTGYERNKRMDALAHTFLSSGMIIWYCTIFAHLSHPVTTKRL